MRDYAALNDDLQADLGDTDCMLTSDALLSDANRLWLRNSFWKKFQDDVSPDADSKCLELFLQSNTLCREWRLKPAAMFHEEVIGEVKTQFDNLFFRGPDRRLTSAGILRGVGVGPGASLGAGSNDFYTKLFCSTLTGTSEQLYREYLYSISTHRGLLSAELARKSVYGQETVVGNRLSFVPKTSSISRSICTEPILNMFFQKGIGAVLEDLLSYEFRINLDKQPIFNRRMAQKGSVDGSYGTIDLSSASDSVSLNLLKEVLPPYVMRWLSLCRSPFVTLPNGDVEELHMVSSMGNGFTFPLETLLFAVIVTSCYRVLGIRPRYASDHPSNFAVFGDDIIVRSDAYEFVCDALRLFGFRVNDTKSFNTGWFRESCGGDFFRGKDIRGIYIKSLKTRSDVYSSINRLVRWSAKTGILLPRTIERLSGWVKFLPVPYSAGDTEGIKVPCPPDDLKRNRNGSVVYYAVVPETNDVVFSHAPEETVRYPKHLSRRMRNAFYNAEGVLQSLLGGYIQSPKGEILPDGDDTPSSRRGRAAVRLIDGSRTKIQRRVTHNWRDLYMVESSTQDDDWFVVNALYFKSE